jgi:hypothetical protein
MGQRKRRKHPEQSFIFFSSHRGSSIRLALKYDDASHKETFAEILAPIAAYMDEHPSITHRLQLPINSFFLDFPSNSIQYNLYSERSIAPGGLSHFQVLLSQIMLQFFDDHPVDDEGIFTLAIWLQEAILNGLTSLNQSRQELIAQIIAYLERKEIPCDLQPYQLEETGLFEDLQPYMENANLENLFLQLELVTVICQDRLQNAVEVYFLLLRLMREHLLKLPNEVFLEALYHVYNSVQVDDSV